MSTVVTIAVTAVALVAVVERVVAMWLCLRASRNGQSFRWRLGHRAYVEVDATSRLEDVPPEARLEP